MVHAVRVPAFNAIYFVMGEAAAKPGWTVEPGAWLEIPVNAFYATRTMMSGSWPAVCQAIDDPLHYKMFMDSEDAEPDEWQETGLIFGGTYSEDAWRRRAVDLPEGGETPPEPTAEEVARYEQVMRSIRGGLTTRATHALPCHGAA